MCARVCVGVGGKPLEITFCLLEFKAVLAFCDAVGDNLHIFFDKVSCQHSGHPSCCITS